VSDARDLRLRIIWPYRAGPHVTLRAFASERLRDRRMGTR
jgi:hypothetical protein